MRPSTVVHFRTFDGSNDRLDDPLSWSNLYGCHFEQTPKWVCHMSLDFDASCELLNRSEIRLSADVILPTEARRLKCEVLGTVDRMRHNSVIILTSKPSERRFTRFLDSIFKPALDALQFGNITLVGLQEIPPNCLDLPLDMPKHEIKNSIVRQSELFWNIYAARRAANGKPVARKGKLKLLSLD
jgi:hypothetical protein